MSWLNHIKTLISGIIASIGIVSVAAGIVPIEPDPFKFLEDINRVIVRWALDWWLPPLVKLVGWKLELFPQWQYVTPLLTFYLSVHVWAAVSAQEPSPNPIRAILMRGLAAVLGLMAGTISSSFSFSVGSPPFVSMFVLCLVSIAIYRIGFAFQFAFDRRSEGFWKIFAERVKGAATIVIVGSAISIAGLLASYARQEAAPRLQLACLLSFLLFLGVFHIRSASTTGAAHYQIGQSIIAALMVAAYPLFQHFR